MKVTTDKDRVIQQQFSLLACLLILIALSACGGGGGSSSADSSTSPEEATAAYAWQLPPGFPEPKQQQENPITDAKVKLGRHLFYEVRMSYNQTMSCASCHEQRLAFTDGLSTAIGSTGEVHPRNSMSLTNVVYNSAQNWANPTTLTLHSQALIPLVNETPVELGWSGHEAEILDRFRIDSIYSEMFTKAFPDDTDAVTLLNVAKAVSAFGSTLISGNSAYDKNTYQGQAGALSESAQRGRDLFFSERLECFHCHGGFNFSQSVDHSGTVFSQLEYHNNGLYNLDVDGDGIGDGAFPANNRGLWEFTGKPEDMGRFRAPTLRNIALTAPYMHDGSIATLDEVIDHYARGGRLIEAEPYAGDGAKSPYKSSLIAGFVITDEERADLIAFFNSLTDWGFICDERFSDPYYKIPPHDNCP